MIKWVRLDDNENILEKQNINEIELKNILKIIKNPSKNLKENSLFMIRQYEKREDKIYAWSSSQRIILNKNGYVEMPHYMFDDYDELQRCIEHCSEYPTILRYFDIREAASFVNFVNTNKIAKGDDRSDAYFKTIDKITQSSLKKYYLKSLSMVSREDWPSIHKHFIDRRDCRINSSS